MGEWACPTMLQPPRSPRSPSRWVRAFPVRCRGIFSSRSHDEHEVLFLKGLMPLVFLVASRGRTAAAAYAVPKSAVGTLELSVFGGGYGWLRESLRTQRALRSVRMLT